jgi:hypothetical protein
MGVKRILSDHEKGLIRERQRAQEARADPGAKFFIHVADETDEYGEPLISVLREADDHSKGRG